jgi:hypothetical protein
MNAYRRHSLIGAALVVCLLVAGMLLGCGTAQPPVVTGQQTPHAQANEQARSDAASGEPSPMPKSQYDPERGDYSLISVAPLPLDLELQKLTRAFKDWSATKRLAVRRAISADEAYTLVHFAKRCAVLALRERSALRCEDGLTALSMLDETRIDPMDAAWALGFVSYAITATGAERNKLVVRAASLATPGMAELLVAAKEPVELSELGYVEVRTSEGVGLIQTGGRARYEPTFDMNGLALKLALTLTRGRYVAEPALAEELPPVWFAKDHRSAAEKLLRQARAVVRIMGRLRKEAYADPAAQMFIQWVVEMPTERAANALVSFVGDGKTLDGRFCLGVASGRLFSLLVAGSFREGVAPFESPETLAPLGREAQALLKQAASLAPRPP